MLETFREEGPQRWLLLLSLRGLVFPQQGESILRSILPAGTLWACSNFALWVGICSQFWKFPKTVKSHPNPDQNSQQKTGLGVDKVWFVFKKVGKGEKARGPRHVTIGWTYGMGWEKGPG